jgi:capsular polysaccharide biosynthesis protein
MDEYLERVNPEEEAGISLQELFKILWNNIALILIVTMWVVVIGIVYTFLVVTPKYTSETSIIVQPDYEATGTNEQSAIVIANNLLGTYREFILSNKVMDSVLADVPELSELSRSGLKNMISVSTSSSILLINISVEHPDPVLAKTIAETLADNAIEIANDETNSLPFLQDKLKVLDVAEEPNNPSSPNKTLYMAISVILGGIIAVGIVFIKEFFNNKFKTVEEVEKTLNMKVISAVPGTVKERKLVD